VKEERIKEIVYDIYEDLYLNSDPPISFRHLMDVSPVIDGRIMIPFNEHTIDSDLYNKIMTYHLKKIKVRKHIKDQIKASVMLGCSPRLKQ